MKRCIYIAVIMVIFTLLGNHAARCNQHIPITYDKSHVEELDDLKDYKASLAEVYKIEEPEIYLYEAERWKGEAGDFRKVEIKFKNGNSFKLENVDSWMEILKSREREGRGPAVMQVLKLPDKSDKVAVHPYFIKLDMDQGACILILFGWASESMPGFLSLVYVNQHQAELVFNKHVDLVEIEETPTGGYRLRGNQTLDGPPGPCTKNLWEILIEDQKLSFRYLPFKKIYTHPNPAIELYDCIGWGHHKQPGDFTRIQPTQCEKLALDHYYACWSKLDPNIKLPKNSQRIQRSPYFIVLNKALYRATTLVLYGCDCPKYDDGLPYLHLVHVNSKSSFYAAYIARFKLEEIIETENGYCLIGKTITKDGQEHYDEKIIENGVLIGGGTLIDS